MSSSVEMAIMRMSRREFSNGSSSGDRVNRSRDGGGIDNERIKACLVILATIAPLTPSGLEAGSSRDLNVAGTVIVDSKCSSLEGLALGRSTPSVRGRDEATDVFLKRQLRLFMQHALGDCVFSGNSSNEIGDGKPLLAKHDADLAQLIRHFNSGDFTNALGCACRKATALNIDTSGAWRHKAFGEWGILSSLIRAAAVAHPQAVPKATAALGTELVEMALNLTPLRHSSSNRLITCGHDQGVAILSVALRMVAEADEQSRIENLVAEKGLYSRWFHKCFGVGQPSSEEFTTQGTVDERPKLDSADMLEGGTASNAIGVSEESRWKVIRHASRKQRGAAILMEALCMSVPTDPAFVLKVHRDVLKILLRAKFSGQVRDLVDLVMTRLSDIKGHDEARARAAREATCFEEFQSAEASTKDNQCGVDGDLTNREAGFLLRHFARTGEIPPALRTAILWQPKSWGKLRKILLAPPGKRIAMPELVGDDGVAPRRHEILGEAVGRGGARVEVSLKYRRLLVQQLAKESLLSAKDCETFKKACSEYLEVQRENHSLESLQQKGAFTAGHELRVLQSQFMNPEGTRQCWLAQDAAVNDKSDGSEGFLRIEEQLAVLLQEYFPRALILQMEMDEEDEAPSNISSPPIGCAHERRKVCKPLHHDWVERTLMLLDQILQTWERRMEERSSSQPLQASNTEPSPEAAENNNRGPSAVMVAEALLNSAHCCITAISTCIGQDPMVYSIPTPSSQPFSSSGRDGGQYDQQPRADGPAGGVSECQHTRVEMSSPSQRIGLAFGFVRRILTTAAKVEAIKEALIRRALGLLVNPTRLDDTQILSLAHVLATLSTVVGSRVENGLADLLATSPRLGAADPQNSEMALDSTFHRMEGSKIRTVARLGALFVQSILLQQNKLRIIISEDSDGTGLNCWTSSGVKKVASDRERDLPSKQYGISRQETSRLEAGEQAKFGVPVALMDFLWWVEQRISTERREHEVGVHEQVPHSGFRALSSLLRSVLEYPPVVEAYRCTFMPGASMPPLERILVFEAGLSDRHFFNSPSRLAFLKSVTIGRLLRNGTAIARMTPSNATSLGETNNGASSISCDLAGSGPRAIGFDPRGTGRLTENVRTVWSACISSFFREPRICRAAECRVSHQDSWTRELGCIDGGTWTDLYFRMEHERLRSGVAGTPGSCLEAPAEGGAQSLMESMLQILTEICNLEALGRNMGPSEVIDVPTCDSSVATDMQAKNARKPSLFLQEALAIAQESFNILGIGTSSALLLLADKVIPVIYASEGKDVARTTFRLLWKDYVCKLRPLNPGAVAVLVRIALFLWSHGQDGGCAYRDGEFLKSMSEDLPVLTAEMVRVWPELMGILRVMVGVGGDSAEAHAAKEWASCLTSFHHLQNAIVRNLSAVSLRLTEAGGVMMTESASPLPRAQQVCEDKGAKSTLATNTQASIESMVGGVHTNREGTAPVWKDLCHHVNRSKRKLPARKYPNSWTNRGQDDGSPSKEPLTGEFGVSVDRDRLRESCLFLPNSFAAVMVSSICTAADAARADAKLLPHPVMLDEGIGKKIKIVADEALSSAGCILADERRRSSATSSVIFDNLSCGPEKPIGGGVRQPVSTVWASALVDLIYSPLETAEDPPFDALVRAVVECLGELKVGGDKWLATEQCSKGSRQELVTKHFLTSLLVALIERAPSLIHLFLESRFMPKAGSKCTGRDLRESVAVLEFFLLLSREPPLFNSLRSKVGAVSWLTGVISHYSALARSSPRKRNNLCDVPDALISMMRNSGDWTNLMSFVHSQMGQFAQEELRQIPAVVALQEIDPIVHQYL